MHELDQLIARWRKEVTSTGRVSPETLDELESHLRESAGKLVSCGLSEKDAFAKAMEQLGEVSSIASEFKKLEDASWLPMRFAFWMGSIAIAGILVLTMLKISGPGERVLLVAHVATVTLGYGATFLVGALGICFVGQRCLRDFSDTRLNAVQRGTFRLGLFALAFTGIGVVLAMIWAKRVWGRYWDWDIKETGAFAVICWQLLFLTANQVITRHRHVIPALSLFGNVVVLLAWFGGNHLASHGTDGIRVSILAGVVVIHFVLFLIGLGPAGWLAPRKET